ncbi:MAG: glycoside hydrolase family 3 N-terminal domain-containing protein [Chloroflexota bacterium]
MLPYQNKSLPISERLDDLIGRMTLAEKIGQMTQVEKNSIKSGAITEMGIGSILSGGGGYPDPNTPENWRKMVEGFQKEALEARLGIPMIYGVDAVHGHNNVVGATIFPHNIGLGASDEPDLVQRIAEATAVELKATGVRWNFAPAVSYPLDIRWGRSYEGFSQNTEDITKMSTAYVKGLLGEHMESSILPSVKHFIADGAATWGTSKRIPSDDLELLEKDPTLANAKVGEWMIHYLKLGAWKIDQGVSDIDEETLRRDHLPPYLSAMAAGAKNIMVSYSSWGGLKMHAQRYLLTEVLKGELGFDGFLVTDWEAIDQINPDFYTSVVASINAGIDMVMVPYDYLRFISMMGEAVKKGDVPEERIDDAARRILKVKFEMGLFEQPYCDTPLEMVGHADHRQIAREAVRKTLTLLKNEEALPISKNAERVLVAGVAADDIGFQCGGWTIDWMGRPGAITPGTTILDGIKAQVGETAVRYSLKGDFDERAPVAVVVLAEDPYAEGMGDRSDLHLSADHVALLEKVRPQCDKMIVILMSGRPLIITDQLPIMDAFLAAWLPGTEGDGVTDVLFGDHPFVGKLKYIWPKSMAQIPISAMNGAAPLFAPGDEILT